MTIPYYYGEVKFKQRSLEAIVAKMRQQEIEWYAATRSYLSGFVASEVAMPKTSYMLAYCMDRVYGTMSWGNWLRLPLSFRYDETLEEHEMAIASHPAFGVEAVFGGVGVPVAALNLNIDKV